MKVLITIGLFLLCGCSQDTYTLNDYLHDTKMLFNIEHIGDSSSDQPLKCQDMTSILLEITQEESIDYLIGLGCFEETQYEENVVISKTQAKKCNQIVYDEIYNRDYIETKIDIDELKPIEDNVDLKILEDGIYFQNDELFEVKDGEVKNYDLNKFDLESSFTPNLQDSVILPSGCQTSILPQSFYGDESINFLKNHYFSFKIKDYQVSGSIATNGMDIKVKKKKNDITIENELSIQDLKCNVDISLGKKQFYFRADYILKDTFSISKDVDIKKEKLKLESFKEIKEKLSSVIGKEHLVDDELHLLTFQFDVPSTGKVVKVIMDVSLKLMANGEAKLSFKSSQKQGSQTFQDTLCHLNQQKWEVQPYIEGNIELASVLNFDLKLGDLHIADVALQGGIGAEGISKVHYVDLNKEVIDTENLAVDLLTMQNILDTYDMNQERFVDFCMDVDVYGFSRIKANQKNSLLRKLGIYGSLTPIKKKLSLLHIEDHHIVDTCTKGELLVNPIDAIDVFDISDYQIQLTVGNTAKLTSTKETCIYSSTDSKIVSVDKKGVIKAHKEGYATIIVECDGIKRQCIVFVSKKETAKSRFFSFVI